MPALSSCLGVDAVDAAAARRDDDDATGLSGSSHDLVVGGERPLEERPALAADPVRVQVVVPGPEVEGLADQQRRRLDRSRTHAPYSLPFRAFQATTNPAAPRLVLSARELVHVPLVDDAVRDRGRGRRTVLEVLRPDDLPCARVQHEEAALLLRDIDLPVRDRRAGTRCPRAPSASRGRGTAGGAGASSEPGAFAACRTRRSATAPRRAGRSSASCRASSSA